MKNLFLIIALLVSGILSAQEEGTVMPEFPNGNNGFHDYLEKNVVLPEGFDKKKYLEEHKNRFVTVSVGFTVDVDGSVTNIKVVEGEDEMLDQKAIEIIESMPQWKPGHTKDGTPVKVDFAIPIRFNLM